MAYASQANLERAVGGAAVLKELLDKDGDGIADSAVITEILDRADSEVNSAIQVSVDLASVAASPPNSVIFAATDVAAYLAFTYGTSGQGIPEAIRQRYDDTLRWLNDVAERRRTVGVASKPATDQDVQQITNDPYGSGNSLRDDLKGFW